MAERRIYAIYCSKSHTVKADAKKLIKNMMSFFASDEIIYNASCPKVSYDSLEQRPAIIELLRIIEESINAEETCDVENIYDDTNLLQSKYRIKLCTEKNGIDMDFRWTEDRTAGLYSSTQYIVYKGNYSVTLTMPDETKKNFTRAKSSNKLTINWYVENFVVHLGAIIYEDGETDTKYLFVPKENDPSYYDVYIESSEENSDEKDYKFIGIKDYLTIHRALGLFRTFTKTTGAIPNSRTTLKSWDILHEERTKGLHERVKQRLRKLAKGPSCPGEKRNPDITIYSSGK